MDFYGVGVKFGGVDDMWELFSDKNCWFMGYHEGEKLRLDKQAKAVKIGDILIAKAYGTTSQSNYYIRAIGIVTNTIKPDDVPEKYKDRFLLFGLNTMKIQFSFPQVSMDVAEFIPIQFIMKQTKNLLLRLKKL